MRHLELQEILQKVSSLGWRCEGEPLRNALGQRIQAGDSVDLFNGQFHAGRFFFERRAHGTLIWFIANPNDDRKRRRSCCLMKKEQGFDPNIAGSAILTAALVWMENVPEKEFKKIRPAIHSKLTSNLILGMPAFIHQGVELLQNRFNNFTGEDLQAALEVLPDQFRYLLQKGATFEEVKAIWDETVVRTTLEE